MKKLLFLFGYYFVSSFLLNAQSIQLYVQDFQTGGSDFTLGGSGPGTNTGTNQWIVNNQYSGVPTYPNTMSQDSTYGGTIGFAPYSQYLHIYDVPSGITNCNYNPAVQSDHFAYMTNGICTFGIDSVHFSFFYLCQGSATAYGKVYYSINNGPWIQTGQIQYNNKYKWQYEDITSTAFNNVGDLRFGFRWENDNGAAVDSVACAIDDIDIVGFYDAINTPTNIIIDNVTPNPVCQGGNITINYHLSDTLCDGSYLIELSNSSGSFPGPNTWAISMNYPQISGTQTIQLPNTITASGCYKIRISRTSPPPAITGTASACFSVIVCPNVITTLKPVVTFDSNAVCIGSVIDVPFYSTGVYTVNTYTAQLSNPDGTFPASPTILGTYFNSNTYDPSLGDNPGSVPGKIPNVSPGCNYYIRIISSNPTSTGSVWGPFCIVQCDITTNNTTDLHFCVTDCAVSPLGANSLITIDVGNSGATYSPGNVFSTQLLSNLDFSQLGANGILGSVVATNDTTLNIHIPCKDSLSIIGIPVGISYLRIIATNSNLPDNSLGSLIRLTIGATRATAEIITSYDYPTFLPQDTFCTNDIAASYFFPYNYFDNSTYLWSVNAINGGVPFPSPDGPNSNSLYLILGSPTIITIKVQETSYGCVGPWSPIKTIVVLGPPVIPITGPSNVCQGDTAQYQVPFSNNTYYNWTANNASIIDTSNNQIQLSYANTGTYQITMTAINQCGSVTTNKPIQVHAYPIVFGGVDQTVCAFTSVTLSGSGANSYSWNNGVINGTPFIPTVGSVDYIVTGTESINGCSNTDTVTVFVNANPTPAITGTLTYCESSNSTLDAGVYTSYLWSTTATTQTIIATTANNPITVQVIDSNGCTGTSANVNITQNALPTPTITGTLTYCAGSNTTLDAGVYNSYLWSTTDTTQTLTATTANNPITVQVTDSNGCIGTSSSINITQNALPIPTITGTLSYCAGSNTTLQTGNYNSYQWSNGNTSQSTIVNITDNPVTVSVIDANGCTGTQSVTVISDSITLSTTSTQSGCTTSNGTATATPGGGATPYTYLWNDPASNTAATAINLSAGTYTVTVTDAINCTQTQTESVTQTPGPTATATSTVTDITLGNSTTLTATGGGTYLWTPVTELSCNDCSNPDASPTETTTYCVRVTDSNGCSDSECITINVEIPCNGQLLSTLLPNAFSPNNDGDNDKFCIPNNVCVIEFVLKVFDRWGEKVFESTNITNCWDGSYKGRDLNTAVFVYFFEAKLSNGEKYSQKGNISLIK